MTIANSHSSRLHRGPDRRQSVRLDVLDQLDGQVVIFNLPVKPRDISLGGISTESVVPIPVGSRHLLRLTTHSGRELVVTASVTHQRSVDGPDGRTRFVTGFAFADATAADEIAALIDTLLAEAVIADSPA
jgi:hypothetical protein